MSKNNNNNTNTTKDDSDINKKPKCITSYGDCIFEVIKFPELYNIWSRYIAKFISENTLLFSIFKPKDDKNGWFIRLSVLIIYISFHLCVNILFQINSDTLHLFIQFNEDYGIGRYLPGWVFNILPNILFYLVIHLFKDNLSLREFYLEEKRRIQHIKDNYLTEEEYKTTWEIRKKKEITRIKKFRNNLANYIKLSIIFGLVILIIDWYYISVFFSVYENSFWCIVVNVLMSIVANYIFLLLIDYVLFSLFKINSSKWLLKISSVICGGGFFFVLWKLCKEEHQNTDDDDEIGNEIKEQFQNKKKKKKDDKKKSRNTDKNSIVENQVSPTPTGNVFSCEEFKKEK